MTLIFAIIHICHLHTRANLSGRLRWYGTCPGRMARMLHWFIVRVIRSCSAEDPYRLLSSLGDPHLPEDTITPAKEFYQVPEMTPS